MLRLCDLLFGIDREGAKLEILQFMAKSVPYQGAPEPKGTQWARLFCSSKLISLSQKTMHEERALSRAAPDTQSS